MDETSISTFSKIPTSEIFDQITFKSKKKRHDHHGFAQQTFFKLPSTDMDEDCSHGSKMDNEFECFLFLQISMPTFLFVLFFFHFILFSLFFFFFFSSQWMKYYEYRGPSKSRLIHEIIRENEVTALNRSTSTSIERDRGFMATKRCDVPFSPPSDDVDTEEYKKCHPRNSKKTHRART